MVSFSKKLQFFKKINFSKGSTIKTKRYNELRKDYPNFLFNTLYLYQTTINPPPLSPLMYVPKIADNWEWSIGCIQLKGDFLVEDAAILNTSRNICIEIENVQKPFKLKDDFSTLSVTIKILLSEIGDINRITISQEKIIFSMMLVILGKKLLYQN